MIKLAYDFHIHTSLSPCADLEMIPDSILGMALMNGLDVIAITDHNTTRNCLPVIKRSEKFGLLVIPGIELTTAEEVHVVMLFENIESALKFDKFVYQRLVKVKNNEKIFGEQLLFNEENQFIGKEENLLINVTDISFDEINEVVKRFNALMFPAHIDRDSYSLLSNLGAIPPGSIFKNAEVKNKNNLDNLIIKNPYLDNCNILYNSDAHYLREISEAINHIEVKERNIKAIFESLK